MSELAEHRWIVDAIEGDVARVAEDDLRTIVVPRYLLPDAVREGDVLTLSRRTDGGGSVRIEVFIDTAGTRRARSRARARAARTLARSRKQDPGGDVSL